MHFTLHMELDFPTQYKCSMSANVYVKANVKSQLMYTLASWCITLKCSIFCKLKKVKKMQDVPKLKRRKIIRQELDAKLEKASPVLNELHLYQIFLLTETPRKLVFRIGSNLIYFQGDGNNFSWFDNKLSSICQY